MDKKEIIKESIRLKMVIGFMYKNEVRIVAPLCLGTHKDSNDTKLLAYFIDGVSESKYFGKNESDLRLYDLDLIIDPKPELKDFEALVTTEYVRRNFSSVIESI